MIYERPSRNGTRYAVRVHLGGGEWQWCGTFDTRAEAERVEAEGVRVVRGYRERQCLKCRKRFTPKDPRQVRCLDPCGRSSGYGESTDDHWLYRCYDASGVLLYVGITSTGTKRFRRHGNDRGWWAEVEWIKVDHFATRAEAEAAESDAIDRLKPRHNRGSGSTGRSRQ